MKIGVFTTLKITNGTPLFFEQHRERLLSQAAKLNIGHTTITLETIQKYLINNSLKDCVLKLTVTVQNDAPNLILEQRPLPKNATANKVITVEDTRNYLKIYKTTNRTINDAAKKMAEEKDADDAIFTVNGTIIESTISNVFSVNKLGELITPPIRAKGLNGITRQLIMQNAKVIETEINKNTKGPLVLVNSLRIQKVTHLNGKKLLDGEKLLQQILSMVDKRESEYLQKFTYHA
ncbi:MAG TPA: aminotransferase class IV [Candidatus Acidoferrales bacterium]|nr:aminotransferase class IV [Candidatus Acidoferrales bacterium]